MVEGKDSLLPRSSLYMETLTHIDVRTLSQSELYALSLCSSSACDFSYNSVDVVVPAIDPSLFNESAGSRRQTYSLSRRRTDAQSSSLSAHRRRVPGLLSSPNLAPLPADDPENVEDRSIVNNVKQFISVNPQFEQNDLFAPLPPPMLVEIRSNHGEMEMEQMDNKRKRETKHKRSQVNDDRAFGIENKNGAVVDLSALANLEDPYGEELGRRTMGLESEEQLLGFMTELAGQWGSRRKRRKFVDASDFGDALPVGWKLVLGLKRKEGRASIYCRRYVSPRGEEFASCKEVSSYLQSLFGLSSSYQLVDLAAENSLHKDWVASENQAGLTYNRNDQRKNIVSGSSLYSFQKSNEDENEVGLLGIDNLAEVQISDLFECHNCEMTFSERDKYLQHLLSFHQKTTRRFRVGSSVGDGVIIKDGKYECQFCHKVFEERRRYNGHVGIHVRTYRRRVEEESGPTSEKIIQAPSTNEFPSGTSKMDALVEIAQNSILQTSTIRCNDEPNDSSTPDVIVVSSPELPDGDSDCEMENIDLDHELHQLNTTDAINDEKKENMDDAINAEDVKLESYLDGTTSLVGNAELANSHVILEGKVGLAADETDSFCTEQRKDPNLPNMLNNLKVYDLEEHLNLHCSSVFEHTEHDGIGNDKYAKLGIGSGRGNNETANNAVTNVVLQTSEEVAIECGVSDSSMPMVQHSHDFPIVNVISDKGGNEFCGVDQGNRLPAFEELKFDDLLNFAISGKEDDASMDEVPVDLTNNRETERTYHSPIQFEAEVMLNMAGRHQVASPCVWCGIEFSHETVDADAHSDSVGFMCPPCKAKISGQYNMMGDGSTMNSGND